MLPFNKIPILCVNRTTRLFKEVNLHVWNYRDSVWFDESSLAELCGEFKPLTTTRGSRSNINQNLQLVNAYIVNSTTQTEAPQSSLFLYANEIWSPVVQKKNGKAKKKMLSFNSTVV